MSDNSYNTPTDSFILTKFGIEPGEEVRISTEEFSDQWHCGPRFVPLHFIYIGSPDLWLLGKGRCYVGRSEQEDGTGKGAWLFSAHLPCDSFRPPAPTFASWPVFDCIGNHLVLMVANRGSNRANFVARLGGRFEDLHQDASCGTRPLRGLFG